jgi:hypothetical protein
MIDYSHCPDCSTPLGKDHSKCRCGWTAPAARDQIHQLNRVPCADDAQCRYPGRIWFPGMPRRERVCVEHASQRFARGEQDDVPVKR